MANVKITDLTALSAADVASNDVLPIVDLNVDQTKKIAISDLTTATSASNDFITFSRLNANINVVQNNVEARHTQLNANLNVLDANADAIEARRVANVTVMNDEDTALQSRLTTNVNLFTAEDVRINANVDVVQDNVTAVESRRVANVTIMTDEDTALQSRLATNVTAFTNEDTALQSRLATNVTAFTNEDTALQSRLATNVTAFTNEDTALQSRLATNVTAFTNEDTALQARIAANTLVAASNDFITFTRLNANINVVQDNVAGLTSTLTIRGDNASDDAVTLGSETLTFVGDTGLTTSVSSNTVTIDLDDTAVTAGLYGGVIGAVSNVPAITIDAQGRITNAANVEIAVDLSTLEGNVNTVSSNTDAVEARRVANIAGAISTVLTSDLTASRAMVTNGSGKIAVSDVTSTELGYLDGVSSAIQTQLDAKSTTANATALAAEDAALQSRLSTNVTAFTNEDTALQSRLSTNVTAFTNEDTALQARITANNTLTSAVETRRAANIAGAVSTITTSDLTASRAMVTNGSGKVDVSAVTATELGYLDGVSSAIQTQLDAKAALAGATFSGQVNMSDDLVVSGNLTVNGDTTTANSVNLVVQDRMIMLANSATGSPSADVGILFNRGDEGNAAIFYDESASTFKLSDTKDPSSNTSLSPVTSSNLDVGILTATTVKQNGANLDDLISSNVDGAISTVNDTNLTASRALTSSSGGKIEVSAVTATELGYLDGVSSAIQTQIDSKQATITGAATTIDDADLTASRALVSSGSGKVAVSAVTATEVGYLDGVSSAIQTQLDAKSTTSNAAALAAEDVALQARITANNTATTAVETRRAANIAGAVSTITTSDLTASRAMVTNGSGKVAVSAVTATELGYLDGVSSAIQTQIDSKQATITGAATTIDDTNLTASRALVSDGSGKVAVSAVTSTELGYLDGVTSAIQTQFTGAETRRTNNIAGAISTVTTSDLTASRALVSGSGGKIEVSAITATELGHLDGIDQNINANLVALAAGVAGASAADFPTGDYGLLDSANVSTDAFGEVTGGLTQFDMKTSPTGSVSTEDLGALT